MKSFPLIVLSLLSFTALRAELPLLEEPSTIESLNSELPAMDEEMLFDEELVLLDEKTEDVNQEIDALDDAAAPIAIEIPTPAEIEQTLVQEALPLSEPDIALEIADEIASIQDEGLTHIAIQSSSSELKKANLDIELDLKRAFAGSPLIYTLLFGMSAFAVFVWLYSILSLKKSATISEQVLGTLHTNLSSNHFDQALTLCNGEDSLLCKMVATGIQTRKYGLSSMIESMKAEGKRSSMNFWQKINLLNDIAILAPMLGLLGTVLGMFYAFYDVNRSIESISSLFDGLGISVGTTVAGLIVAILALILHSTAKYRLMRALSQVESEAHRFASLIDSHASLYGQPK